MKNRVRYRRIMEHGSQSYLRIAALFTACLLFAGAYYQWPLFSQNQNTYFLIGLARAGYGYLSSDWLSQQTDIVPAFSAMVSLVHSLGSHWMFYALHGVITTLYALSLFTMTVRSSGSAWRPLQAAVFFALLTLVHSAWILNPFFNLLPRLSPVIVFIRQFADSSTNGLAGQYILGRMLQPSAFGMLFLTSLALFIHGKEYVATLCVVVAAMIHTSLILHAGILIADYMTVLMSEKRVGRAVKIGTLALALILPIVLYVGHHFVFSDTRAIHSVAQAISAEVRQPHHANISVRFSGWSCVQFAILAAGLVLSRQCKRLFMVLLLCTITATGLTLVQVVSGSLALALLFPWRTSTWLVPACTAIVLGNVSIFAGTIVKMVPVPQIRRFTRTSVVLLSITVLGGLCLLGLRKTILQARADLDHGTVISYAKMHAARDQTYLVPLNLERFRLAAGVPIFVDWKSHPFRSSEIIEWYDRVRLARAFYEAKNSGDAIVALTNIRERARVTHVIVELNADHLHRIVQLRFKFRDKEHVVYKIKNDEDVEESDAPTRNSAPLPSAPALASDP